MLIFVTVVLNAFDTIERCLLSVLNQTDKSFKYYVFDGGSTDGTRELVMSYIIRGHDIVLIDQKDGGIYDAMNKAMKYLKSGYVLFVNADDELYDKDVSLRINRSLVNRTIIAPVYWVDSQKNLNYNREKSWTYMQPGTVYFLEIFPPWAEFDLRFSVAADLDFAYKFLSIENCVFFDKPLIRMHSGGVSSGRVSKIEAVIVHMGNLNLYPAFKAMIKYIVQAIR